MTLTTRLAAAMIALVAVTVTAVGWLSYRNIEQAILPRALDRIETHSRLVASGLESHVRGARGDIAGFRSAAALNGLIRAHAAGGIDPVDGLSEATWRERIADRLLAELRAKPAYAQFRIIGIEDGGREMVRADRSGPNGDARLAPDAELQREGERDYFRDTVGLAPGEIYVSAVELNQEGDGVETPYVPTLRIATPLREPDGKPFGIVIVNVDMRPAFDRVRSTAQPGGAIYVVGKQGDYLVHPDPTREFGSGLGRPADWRKDFPSLASSVGATKAAVQTVPDQAGRPDGVALAPTILAGREWIAVIETVPNAIIMAPALTIRNTSLIVGLVAVLCAAALAVLIAQSLARPIVQLTAAVEGIADGRQMAIPVEGGGETGVLAQAFSRMVAESTEKTQALIREIAEHRRTEAARDHHAERESLYSAAVEFSNDAIITKSLDGIITGWNPAAERLFGYSSTEAVGQHALLIVPIERWPEMNNILSRISQGERIRQHETIRLRKDGAPVEVSLSISPIKATSGAIIGISETVQDVTERNRTQQTLQRQTEERRHIFETSQDLLVVLNDKGFLVQISPSCEAVLGYKPEEMIGRSGADFVHPDDLERSREDLRRARRGARLKVADTRYVHKDGHTVWLSWLGAWSDPAKRFFFAGRDMTESRKAQESLRDSEQLARGIIDTALDAFVQMDEAGNVCDWNSQAEKLFGWSRDEAIGQKLSSLIIPEVHRAGHEAGLQHFLHSGTKNNLGRRIEIEAVRRDGTKLPVELSATELKRRDGFLFNGFIRDLTDKVAAEERIRQAEKMEAVGQLTGGIAHDFNNILTVITGTIGILADALNDEPQLAAIAKMIDEAAWRGADLTQHLLAFARKQPLNPRETDINVLIMDTTKLLQRTLGEHVSIEAVFNDEACLAIVDPNQLTTALLNLALNARDAMPEGGKLVIETGYVVLDDNYAKMHNDVRSDRYAMIAVSDTGIGIPAAIIDRVFDPFFTSKEPGKGTGLGLSMVYGFIKQSTGHIKIYSEEGHGTTIRMYLPPATGTSLTTDVVHAPAIRGGDETILVVEDDKLVRNYVLAQLHSLGYVTLAATNAAEALAIVHAGERFDLLFTDVIMPGLNGRQLADEVQKSRPEMKVLFTSGYTENAIIHHGRLDEGVLLLVKPYRKSDMAAMIRKALAS